MTPHTSTNHPRPKQRDGVIPGRATSAGTRRLADRLNGSFATDFYRDTELGFTISSLGMGTYLGACDDTEDSRYADTLEAGMQRGLNILDTAINYRCQRSERAVGRALQALLAAGSSRRDEIVVCTKAGYIPLDGAPPSSREDYDTILQSEYFDHGIMQRDDVVAGGHCLAPSFLANQISRSRANLGVQCIDVLYIHNPEQQLEVLRRPEFLAVMRATFAELEEQVASGNIAAYGCASWNGFRVFAASRNYLSLTELASLATEVGGKNHHFRAIQLPVNLAMTEAIRAPAQQAGGRNVDILTLARELGIAVVASATLMQAQLAQNLPAPVRSLFPSLQTDAQCAIAFVRSLPIASALVGMRSAAHLEENLAACSPPAA